MTDMDDKTISDALATVADLKELSAPSVVLAVTATNVAGPLLASVGEKVVNEVVGQAIGEMANAVPVVGMFVGIATGIIKLAGASVEQRQAQKQEVCRNTFQMRRVVPSGSKLGGCEQCPCDLFRVMPWVGRPLLGQALVAVTEGGDMGTVGLGLTGVRPTFGPWWRERYAMVCDVAKTRLSEKRRMQYRSLRLAMEKAYVGPNDTTASNGGVTWWPAYLDMILADLEAGVITERYIDLCLSARYYPKVKGEYVVDNDTDAPIVKRVVPSDSVKFGRTGVLVWGTTNEATCFVPTLRESVLTLASGWRETVRPRYEEGKRALREIEAVAQQMKPQATRPSISLTRLALGAGGVALAAGSVARPAAALAVARGAGRLAVGAGRVAGRVAVRALAGARTMIARRM